MMLYIDYLDFLCYWKFGIGNYWWVLNFIGLCMFRLCQMVVKNIKFLCVLNLFFKI